MKNYSNNIFKNIEGIIFDLDDTLYNRNLFEYGAYRKISDTIEKHYQIKSQELFKSLKLIKEKRFSNYKYLFKDSLKMCNAYDNQIENECLEIYRSYVPSNLNLFEGVEETLYKIKDKFKLGIITNGRKETQIKKIKALKIEKFFDSIIFSDELGKNRKYRKPHIKPYEMMSKLLNKRTNKLCYIGDNPYIDFIGAKKLEFLCVRVLTGEYKKEKNYNKYIYEFESIREIFNE